MPDYYAMYDKLLERAGHPKTPPAEAKACRAKAEEIMLKHLQPDYRKPGFMVQDTIITSRDGRNDDFNDVFWRGRHQKQDVNPETAKFWAEYMQRLLDNQWQWNMPPSYDEEDIIEETYRYDEDERYEIFEEEEEPL